MAFTDFAKKLFMETESFDAGDKYIALGTFANGTVTELSGSGYKRGTWLTTNMRAADNGNVTGDAFVIYTATDSNATQATRTAIFDTLTGGNQVTEWETINNPPCLLYTSPSPRDS